MQPLIYKWSEGGCENKINLLVVKGTSNEPYFFGKQNNKIPVSIPDFHVLNTQVTQELWKHVMGNNPAVHSAFNHPIENVSWEQITAPDGFLERINTGDVLAALAPGGGFRFRLPSETEWEYAARGGPAWTDGFVFSGSNNIDSVAWYGPKFGTVRRLICNVFGWRLGWRMTGRPIPRPATSTHAVALKAPNQIGLYDMSGNVWEWCEDVCTDNLAEVPRDGKPFLGPGTERRLRGGCHHNWDLHCTVSWRYGIDPGAHDGCIGFRLVLAQEQ